MKQYDEYELIEVDQDEAHVLDMMDEAQVEHWGLEQEQALLRDIDRRTNAFYPTAGEKGITR